MKRQGVESKEESNKKQKTSSFDTIELVKARIAEKRAALLKQNMLQSQQQEAPPQEEKPAVMLAKNMPISKFATSKANVKVAQKVQQQEQKRIQAQQKNPYFDPKSGIDRRIKPNLRFVQPGKFIKEAEKIRKEYDLEQLKLKIAARTRKTGLDAEIETVGDGALLPRPDELPNMQEWWDIHLCKDNSYLISMEKIQEAITDLIHHPAFVEPPVTDDDKIPSQVTLTMRERKRARRLRRMEAQKEKQEKIRLNLLPKEEPKLKMSNVMRVLGTEAVLDPTAVESLVKKQVQERLEKHLRENEERKLSSDQVSDKNRKKWEEDTKNMVHVAAFRIKRMDNPSHKFKIVKNAEQMNLTGAGLCYRDGMNFIVVEGGPKGIRKYKHLLMERIEWQDDQCDLIWEGMMNKPQYPRKLRLVQVATIEMLRDELGEAYKHLIDIK